ncbi:MULTISPECIES: hypothetical protein [Streptomyces violaceusniger group]|uniref:DNA polymerase III beta sliding clamp central domain-containing protein n=2 Tax=Streptomyces rhizosphaericus TaxID=114699 RepID=A0ABN1NZ82_9ACTN|nr:MULTISPECIES: hypothetical protein [Streptomyces violaceusniger group]
MAPSATLNAHNLARLIRTAAPHAAADGIGLDQIDGIRFDSDGTHLHAVASDRYTVAVARARLTTPGEPFARTVHGQDVASLRAWVDAHDGEAALTLTTEIGRLAFDGPRGTLRISVMDGEKFPDWRQLLHTALADVPADAPCTRWTSRFWERWQHANREVNTWHAGGEKPLIVLGTDVIGLQAPHRMRTPEQDQTQTTSDALDVWKTSLGTDTGQRTDLADAIPEPPRRSYTAASTVPEMTEELLRQTLNATNGLFSAPSDDPGAVAAYALSGVHAWAAYRFLKALIKSDPDLAADTVADLAEQLDSGEIGEWAWDAAVEAGHDPQKWADDRAQARAEKSATTDSAATSG